MEADDFDVRHGYTASEREAWHQDLSWGCSSAHTYSSDCRFFGQSMTSSEYKSYASLDSTACAGGVPHVDVAEALSNPEVLARNMAYPCHHNIGYTQQELDEWDADPLWVPSDNVASISYHEPAGVLTDGTTTQTSASMQGSDGASHSSDVIKSKSSTSSSDSREASTSSSDNSERPPETPFWTNWLER